MLERITRTVYSLYWPETRMVVDELWKSAPHDMYEDAYTKKQDDMHRPFLETWLDWTGLGLRTAFPHAYPTNGASEAIDHLIVPPGRIHMFEGEYEGYARIAEARGMDVRTHRREPAPLALLNRSRVGLAGTKELFFVSLPSAIDGEYWPDFDEFCETLARWNPEINIVVDVTYVGAAKKLQPLHLSRYPNVSAVVFSLSKPFGVYYHRIGGVVSRQPIETLWGNLWFKNLFSLQLGTELMRRYPVEYLPNRYAAVQRQAISDAIVRGELPADTQASNVVLLARSATGVSDMRRAPDKYRYCLTPDMARTIKGVR